MAASKHSSPDTARVPPRQGLTLGEARALLRGMSSWWRSTREAAAREVSALASRPENRETLAEAGAVQPLVKVLHHGTGAGKMDAAFALCHLAQDAPIRRSAILSAGADVVPELQNLLAQHFVQVMVELGITEDSPVAQMAIGNLMQDEGLRGIVDMDTCLSELKRRRVLLKDRSKWNAATRGFQETMDAFKGLYQLLEDLVFQEKVKRLKCAREIMAAGGSPSMMAVIVHEIKELESLEAHTKGWMQSWM